MSVQMCEPPGQETVPLPSPNLHLGLWGSEQPRKGPRPAAAHTPTKAEGFVQEKPTALKRIFTSEHVFCSLQRSQRLETLTWRKT